MFPFIFSTFSPLLPYGATPSTATTKWEWRIVPVLFFIMSRYAKLTHWRDWWDAMGTSANWHIIFCIECRLQRFCGCDAFGRAECHCPHSTATGQFASNRRVRYCWLSIWGKFVSWFSTDIMILGVIPHVALIVLLWSWNLWMYAITEFV